MFRLSQHHASGRFKTLGTPLGHFLLGPASSGATGGRRFRPRVELLEDRCLLSVSVLQNIAGVNFSQTAGLTPPDTMLAVGPNAVVEAVNRAITLTNKTGGARVGPIDFSVFFSSIYTSGDGFSNPQVVYDDQANCFYICVTETSPVDPTRDVLDFAVSKSSSPASLGSTDWTVFPKISSVNENTGFTPDYPQMGWNNDAVFISTNQFGSLFDHNLILAISKASILAGGPLTTKQINVNTGSERRILIPARMHNESTGNLEYFVQSEGDVTSSTVAVTTETNYLSGALTFTPTKVSVNPYNNSPGVAGLTGQMDDRILSVDWIDNGISQHLVASGNVGEGGVNLARWYEFNAPLSGTPTLVQQGDINLGPAISTSFPSIAINSSDTIGMTFLENGGGQATSMYVTGRVASDPLNTMQTPLLVKAGVLPATNMVLDENIFNRGGAYSAIEFDPSNPADFWSANLFQFDGSGKYFDWGTQIAQYQLVPGPAVTAVSNQTATEGIGQSFSLGSLTDPASGPWMVTVNWGDSTPTTTFSTSSQGTVPSQTHTYLEEGAYTVLVTVTDTMSNLSAAGNFQVSVAMVGSSAINLLQSYAGIKSADTSGSTPPDSMMAVGPSSTIETVNTAILIKSKDGHVLAGPVELLTFFSGVVANGDVCAEPQLLYDDQAGVFYVCVLEYAYDAFNHPDISHASIDLAVSKTSNPTSTNNLDWTLFGRITSATEGGTEFPDVPKLGWNRDAVFVSTNQFSQNFQSYDHNLIIAISKSSILGGGPLVTHQTVVSSSADRHILIPARMHNESSGNLEYFVQSLGGVSSTMVNVLTETGYLSGAGTFTSTPLGVNPYNNSPGVAGLTGQMDDRILSVDWIDNGISQHLVASGNVGEGGVNLARWYEFNAPLSGTPTLVQQGDINLGPAISTSFPSIAINSSDTIGMTFLENGGGQATSMYVTGRVASDPLNTMEDEVLVQAGVLPATDPLRGGDFSATEFDPSKPANFWSTNEFQFDNSGSNFNWGTQIVEYTFNVSTLPFQVLPPANQSAMEGTSLSVNLGAFTDSGTGPWTASVAWGDGASIMLPAPLAPGLLGNQPHAYTEEGTYTVTVTVTDTGSNASGSAMFTVSVSELNVVATPASLSPTAGGPFSGAVATFMDPGGAEPNDGTHYSASINWGDGSATATANISLSGSIFSVNGMHTYAAANSYTITVTINHEGNPVLVQSQTMVASLGQFVSAGTVKPISFWEGLQGQQLVRRFGTTSDGRTLGQWLATTYPNLYGGIGGAPNLSPFTLAQISSYYQSLFLASKGTGLDAEVLATALEVFATTSSLGGSVGQSFGFTVTSTGLGADSWNIGGSGQAFGVPNLTVLNVYQILLSANNSAVVGEPWGINTLFRNEAFTVFHGINGG